MPNLSTKERKAEFNTDYLISRKEFNLPFGTLLSLSIYVDIEYNLAEWLTNKYKRERKKIKIISKRKNKWNKITERRSRK